MTNDNMLATSGKEEVGVLAYGMAQAVAEYGPGCGDHVPEP